MSACWFKGLPDAGPCEGRLRLCHLVPKSLLKREFPHGVVVVESTVTTSLRRAARHEELGISLLELVEDRRCWVSGCGGLGYGNAGHHGQFKPDGPKPIPRHRLPAVLEQFAAELGLGWWLDRTYGERSGDVAGS